MNTASIKPARIGSISHGTLRTEDLLEKFASELESLIFINGDYFSRPENFAERDRLNDLVGYAQDAWSDDGQSIREDLDGTAEELVEDLTQELEQFAPPYCYFGAHYGDGADFGFWPDHDAINDLPQIANNGAEDIAREQSDDFRTDVRYVNDHGNVTVYGGDGSVLLEIV